MNSGISYFPLEVQLDDRLELIEAEFGLTGFSVIVKIYQKIYSGAGYYCKWTEDIALMFGKKTGIGTETADKIIKAAIKRGIFSEHMFNEYSILTSPEIQKRYLDIVKRRKRVELDKRYLMVDIDPECGNVYITGENADNFSKNEYIFEQRKEKESKGKESKEKKKENTGAMNAARAESACDDEQKIFDKLKSCSVKLSRNTINAVKARAANTAPEVIMYAIDEADKRSKRNWGYIEAILDRLRAEGAENISQIRKREESYTARKRRFTDKDTSVFQPDGTDYADIERRMNEKY